MVEAGDVLASDAKREAAVARLRQEVAVGRLDTAEFERRVVLEPPAESRRTPRRERVRVRRTRR